jgi:hypothetical protein
MAGMATPSLEQDHSRWRSDSNGPNGTPTWEAVEDTANVTWPVDTQIRLRIGLQEAGGANVGSKQFGLWYSKNSGAYTAVTGSSTNVVASDVAGQADDQAVTSGVLAGLTGTFINGGFDDATGTYPVNINVTSNNNTELEFSIELVDADVAAGDTFDFEVREIGNTQIDVYNHRPRLTASEPKTASGTPSANAASTSGSAKVVKDASGTPSAGTASTSGAAEREASASGTPTAVTATAEGDATVPGGSHDASGTVQANVASTSGSAVRTADATGTPAANVATTSGNAVRVWTASGTVSALLATTSATAIRVHEPSGSPQANVASASGTGERTAKASQGLQANSASTSGTGTREAFANGVPQADPATTDGNAGDGSGPTPLTTSHLGDMWLEYFDSQGVLGWSFNDRFLTALRQENGVTGGDLNSNLHQYFKSKGFDGAVSDQYMEFLRTHYPEYGGSFNDHLYDTLKSGRFFL